MKTSESHAAAPVAPKTHAGPLLLISAVLPQFRLSLRGFGLEGAPPLRSIYGDVHQHTPTPPRRWIRSLSLHPARRASDPLQLPRVMRVTRRMRVHPPSASAHKYGLAAPVAGCDVCSSGSDPAIPSPDPCVFAPLGRHQHPEESVGLQSPCQQNTRRPRCRGPPGGSRSDALRAGDRWWP